MMAGQTSGSQQQFMAWTQQAQDLRQSLEQFRNQETSEEGRRYLSTAITHLEEAELRVQHLVGSKIHGKTPGEFSMSEVLASR